MYAYVLCSFAASLVTYAAAVPAMTSSAMASDVTAVTLTLSTQPETTLVVPAGIPAQTSAVPLPYVPTGNLTAPETFPYMPSGGIGTNGSVPVYAPLSDFDYYSLQLGLYQEYIELDLFHHGLAMFSDAEWQAAGFSSADQFLIEFMADQEVSHSTMLSHMIGPTAVKQCTYEYPFTTIPEFIDFCQKLTRFGESGVYGFLSHMNSGAAATNLLLAITTEARQQYTFRQFEGLFPMEGVRFMTGITQSMQWTLLAPFIKSCPANNTKLVWQNFPALNITNNPSGYDPLHGPAVSTNVTALSYPGRTVTLEWEKPGKPVGPDGAYTTNTTATGPAKFAAWISQLNVTYTPLMNISGNTASTIQPGQETLPGDPSVNGTMFLAITDVDLYVTTYNISFLNPHIVAGPAMYQAG